MLDLGRSEIQDHAEYSGQEQSYSDIRKQLIILGTVVFELEMPL